jgi:SpoVK/Ycf46/Vps4 family AAA+-type ATPase
MSDEAAAPELPAFGELLVRCRALYHDCAVEWARSHPEMVPDAAAFIESMVTLHRGLVVKVFIETALADRKVGAAELELGRQVIEHAFGKRLDDRQLRETLANFSETTHQRWESLLRPFQRMSTFRARADEVAEVVEQMVLHIQRASGHKDSRTRRHLKWVRAELRRVLDRPGVSGVPPAPVERPSKGTQAQQADFELDARGVRQERAVRRLSGAGQEQLDEVLEELDSLIGLDCIKQDVRELVNFLKIQAERVRHDLPQTAVSLHAVFAGNPGTGKTTVARLLGRIFGAMGVLAKGHLIETDRSGLVAEYAGQTGPKTHQRIDEALDGVLFIDEAYSLVAESGDDPYGTEALQALLKRMEDDRDRLIVILAGYPRPMEALLRKNPGLSSRFPRTFNFPDYTSPELGRIFETMCARDSYVLPGRTRARLLVGFQWLLAHRDEHFGNGRLARNVYERSLRRLANRLAAVTPLTRELLTTLEPDDVLMQGVPESAWEVLGEEGRGFKFTCPSCAACSRLPAQALGRKVACRRCGHEFTADWGEAG